MWNKNVFGRVRTYLNCCHDQKGFRSQTKRKEWYTHFATTQDLRLGSVLSSKWQVLSISDWQGLARYFQFRKASGKGIRQMANPLVLRGRESKIIFTMSYTFIETTSQKSFKAKRYIAGGVKTDDCLDFQRLQSPLVETGWIADYTPDVSFVSYENAKIHSAVSVTPSTVAVNNSVLLQAGKLACMCPSLMCLGVHMWQSVLLQCLHLPVSQEWAGWAETKF